MMKNWLLFLAVLCVCVCGITGYTVTGNKIYDPNGKQITIKGMCRPSFEWNQAGEHASLSDYTLMKNSWGANVVRISLNQDYWLSTASYATTIDQQITWVTSLGMGVILDLHWNNGGQQNMADRNSITFWSSVAARYKANQWVMFELYNEPHDVTWSQWLNGDSTYAGMQNMYDAVRAAGSSNVVIVGGLNWAFDLSGVGNGYAVKGTNVAYATHPYNYDGKNIADWPAAFGYLVPTYPIIMTEFGQYCASGTYVNDLLNYAQSLGIHWTAWAWYVSGCAFPSVISDWNGTPYPGVGETVKSYMTSGSTSTGSSTSAPSSAPTSAPTTAPQASGSLAVYTDSLASGWQDWSWAPDRNLAATQYAHSGSKSISFELVSYNGVYFHATSNFAVSAYKTLVFYVNGGSSAKAGGVLKVNLYSTSNVMIGNAITVSTAPQASTWTQVSVSVADFGVSASTLISGLSIQSAFEASQGIVYLDDISFVPASSSATAAPTTAPTKAPTTAPTKAPTTAPTTAPTKAPTTAPTTAPTKAPTTAPTSAPTKAPTTAPTTAPSAGCGVSSVKLVQSGAGEWQSGGQTINQYNVEITHTCSGKKLVGMTITPTNYNPINAWNVEKSGSILNLPSYVSLATSNSFSFGYQNVGGQASFTINSVTFQ